MKLRKIVSIILVLSILMLASACGKTPETVTSPSDTASATDTTATTAPTEAEIIDDTPPKIDLANGSFTWNPFVWSETLTKVYGESCKETTFNCIRAMMNGEDTFEYVNEADVWNMIMAAYVVCPYYFKISSYDLTLNNGVATIDYLCSKEEAKKIIDDFGKEVESIIAPVVADDDSDKVKALMVHYNFSSTLKYDYVLSGEAEPEPGDTADHDDASSYRAIMDREGICQSFAMALAHLYLECGLDPNLVGAQSPKWAHMFVLLKIDGEPLFIDPTWEDSHNGTGLSFFGITNKVYEENDYQVDAVTMFDDGSFNGKATSKRFDALWGMKKLNSIQRVEHTIFIDYINADGQNAYFTMGND